MKKQRIKVEPIKYNQCKVHLRCIDKATGVCKYFRKGQFSWCIDYDGPHCRSEEAQEEAMLDHLESLALKDTEGAG